MILVPIRVAAAVSRRVVCLQIGLHLLFHAFLLLALEQVGDVAKCDVNRRWIGRDATGPLAVILLFQVKGVPPWIGEPLSYARGIGRHILLNIGFPVEHVELCKNQVESNRCLLRDR